MSWFDDSNSGNAADLEAFMDSEVPKLFARIVGAGALVSLGRTSDGGAISITVTLDGRYKRNYFRESHEAADWLLEAAAAVEAEADASPASRDRRSRSRGR